VSFPLLSKTAQRHPTQLTWLFPKEAELNRWLRFSSQAGAAQETEEAIVASATITATTIGLKIGSADAARKAATSAPPVSNLTAASGLAKWATKDGGRKWVWWFLAILAASQVYFVRELLVAFALFVLAFGAIAVVVIGFYMLQKSWELALARLAATRKANLQISPIPHDTRKPA
jgi:hypothetical protein